MGSTDMEKAEAHHSAAMSGRDFRRLGDFIYSECGIKMPDSKKVMLEARLRKRLRALGMRSYSAYCDYIFSPQGAEEEIVHMIDLVTTNKTDFFREPRHFEYLAGTAVPELISTAGAGIRKRLMVWSAGCSTGEEPYTLAMVLSDVAAECRGFQFLVLATDISTRVLDLAKNAVYEEERIAPVPWEMRKKYLLRSRDRSKRLVRIASALRETVKFRRLNFMDGDFGMRAPLDIIFCRNVIIYFDRPTQESLLNRFCGHLIDGGYLFMGHSETLHGLDVPLIQVAPTIYRKIS